MADTNIKCSNCKQYKIADDFKKDDKVLKTCIKCRMKSTKSKFKNKSKRKCIHIRCKYNCKLCGDEKKITIQNIIMGSRSADKIRNQYDIVNFIDKSFLKNLIEDCNDKCYYCKCKLQYIIRQPNLATIERIDNSIGHIKSNVVIACYLCNVSRVGDKLN
jgi:hypothetical protein